MRYPSIVFSEPGSSDLLRPHQSFLAKSAHRIYYVSPRNRYKEIGSPYLLFPTPQSGRWLQLCGDVCGGGELAGVAKNGDGLRFMAHKQKRPAAGNDITLFRGIQIMRVYYGLPPNHFLANPVRLIYYDPPISRC